MRSAALFVVLVAATSCASAPPGGEGDAARFEKLKSLAGTWTIRGAGEMPEGGKVTYRVTAAGSAVHETDFLGTPHEMVTIYTLDRGRLHLTHYCALGNQPRMELEPSPRDDTLVFDLRSLGNGNPSRDMHMHHAEITFVDADHLRSAWTLWEDGRPGDTHRMTLERAAD